ncbi:uncharacterized protein [Zea mays]|nr:uncharacterized protein LOC103652791 isoform X10 [Zea mays]|eukprot:XP_020408040.1 uncharacterized protein LOC103652791 isoform X8 [Zea mays]
MSTQDDTYRTLECMLCDKKGKPLSLKQHFLERITNNFSEDNLVGRGGYGEVYKGVLEDGFVAVKKLYSYIAIEDEPFHREVDCLMNIRHHNIVLFVGYCAETQEVVVRQEGKHIFAEKRERLLCFEYLHNGSLHKHLTAEPCGLPWHICYQIIKGICLGLHYLHDKNIIHLDLKPDNILLDDDMVPKITDFGLSRLLGNGKSHTITQTRIGTWGYMAPEYLDDGVITMKTDIYSLGVIIRHMVKGRNSADTTDEEVLANWLIRLEKDPSQMMRQQTTRLLFETEYKEQIKACMDISWRCTLRKPMDRPTTQHILLTLEETEAKIKSVVGPTPPNAGQLQIAKFGPWGGDGGKTRDIRMTPCHLHSVTISSGTIIDSIGFSFTDHYGQHHTTGPWGGKEGTNKARVARIGRPLGGDEGVLHGITDLSGQQRSRGGGPSGECGDSDDEPNGDFAKFGPWGGDGGQPQDIGTLPCRLDRIKISSGLIIDSIEFSYAGPDSQYRTAGPWGGHGGDNSSFQLAGSEFLTGVSGSIGTFNGHANVITSLTFVTNARSYGPFGRGRGTSFHIPVQGNGCIVGFFGRSGRYLNAIGVYTAPKPEPKAVGKQDGGDEAVVARIGPWGGVGNALHDIAERPHRLHRVTIFSGTIVNSLEYLYSDGDGQQHTTGPWGGCGGTGRKIHLAPEEFIVEVTGTFHPCAWDRTIPSVVSSLTLVTSTGKTHGPFGTQLGAAFQVPVQSDSRIVGFFAHGDNYIEAIGAYVKKLTESSNR